MFNENQKMYKICDKMIIKYNFENYEILSFFCHAYLSERWHYLRWLFFWHYVPI